MHHHEGIRYAQRRMDEGAIGCGAARQLDRGEGVCANVDLGRAPSRHIGIGIAPVTFCVLSESPCRVVGGRGFFFRGYIRVNRTCCYVERQTLWFTSRPARASRSRCIFAHAHN